MTDVPACDETAESGAFASAQSQKPTLDRDTCLLVSEEGLRAASALDLAPEGSERSDCIRSMAESLAELDAIIESGRDGENVLSFARRARSNCARGIAVAVRGAIDWRDISPIALPSLAIVVCLDPDAHAFPPAVAA